MGDEESKYALDGLIAGIIHPYDMECHTFKDRDWHGNTMSYYTKQTELDYPSFGQIRELKRKTSTDIIFLTKETKLQWFKDTSNFLQGFEAVAAFDGNNLNKVAKVIRDQYDRIKSLLKVRYSSQEVEVTIHSDNPKCEEPTDLGLNCNNVPANTNIPLKARLKVNADYCFDNKGEEITIRLDGLSNAELKVTVVCEECENCSPPAKAQHESCNKKGTLTCGACVCE